MSWNCIRRYAAPVAAATLLFACGGGGGGGGGGPTASLSLARTSVGVSGDTSQLPPTVNVDFTVSSVPGAGLYYRYSMDQTAIESASVQLGPDGHGIIELSMWLPRVLGAGIYTDHFRLELCADAQCARQIGGSPATITVTYTVTGAANPSTTFMVTSGTSYAVQAASDAATGPTASIVLAISEMPPAGVYASVTEIPPTGAPAITSGFQPLQTNAGGGTIRIDFKPPAGLSLGTHASSARLQMCFDVACSRPLPGSPVDLQLSYQIVAAAGSDYTLRSLAGFGAHYVAWDSPDGKLVVTAADGVTNRLTLVDPVTGATGSSVALPYDPAGLAVSDDGEYAYVPLAYGAQILRFRLPALTPDLTVTFDPSLLPDEVVVAPGQPHTIAVSFSSSGLAASVAVFDDAVMRSGTFGTFAPQSGDTPYRLAWGADVTTLYALQVNGDHLYSLAVDASGLAARSTDSNTTLFGHLHFAAGLLYADNGQVFDPAAHAGAPPLTAPNSAQTAAVDATTGFAYFLQITPGDQLTRVSLAQPAQTAELPLTGINVAGMPIVRWGANGVAFATYDGDLQIISGSFVAP